MLDVDGVLTDGGLYFDESREMKRFHARDGVGIQLAKAGGWRVLFLSARHSPAARRRAEELGAEWAMGVPAKEMFLDTWLQEKKVAWSDLAFVGDDLQDLAPMRRAGWPIAVLDAAKEVRDAARYVTRVPGGQGAVRDAVEWLLDQQGARERAIQTFLERRDGFAVGKEERGGGTP